ncbi:MAG: sulfite exporter TauE/SafE family protein [Planctomycetaceae bacterium]
MSLTPLELLVVGAAALAAGAVNALAGGGTLISFPVLTAVGVPALQANVTNTVALSPGYLGGTLAQSKDLAGQARRVRLLVPTGVLGGLVGGILLVSTNETTFRTLVPYLILLASGMLALQDRIRAWVVRRTERRAGADPGVGWILAPTFLASVYGGYFGAGLGVILLAVLGLVIEDTLTRINALKQILSFWVNVTAASFFVFSGKVVWPAAIVMAVGALAGGSIGGRFAHRMRPESLRRIVVSIGVVVAAIYLIR